MIHLSKAQSEIIEAPIGNAIQVLASAGSGKTRVLTERIRHILENTKKEGVIALTFTNKAAEEMESRLETVESVEDRCWISTIHAVAQRILEQYGHAIGLPSGLHIYERDQDRMTVFLQSLRENGIDIDTYLNVSDSRTKKDREHIVQRYLEHFSVVKRNLLHEDEVRDRYSEDENFWKIFQDYQQALINSNGIDFDDILVYAHRILFEQSWCGDIYRAKYKHICVDEAQDLNKAQYEFIKALCADSIKSLMMVGDPNQMIYGFNGSSHDYLCKSFIIDFQPSQYELKENYRSSKSVVRLANKLKPSSQTESQFALEGKSVVIAHQDEQAEAEWIVDKIKELLMSKSNPEIEGGITLEKMVVIARNRFVFLTLEKYLDERGIPYSLKKGERLMEPSSSFGKVLDLAIRLRLNPKDWIHGRKLCSVLNITTPDTWENDKILKKFAQEIQASDSLFSEIYASLLMAIQELDIDQPNIPKLVKNFEELLTNIDDVLDNEKELSLQSLIEFRGYWTTFKRKGLGKSLAAFRNAMALGQLSDDFNPNGLTLSTVHTMKGLEKDIVFLMGMCEGVFPDYRAKSAKEISEERNSAFVAVTRSKRWLFITYPKKRMMPWGDTKIQQQSRFISELTS